MSFKNRRSPSGKLTQAQLPFLGCNSIAPNVTQYAPLGYAITSESLEAAGQYLIPEIGILDTLTIKNIVAGADGAPLGLLVYNVRKNGVLIPGATGTLLNTDTTTEVVINVGATPDPADAEVVEGDLIGIEIVAPNFPGANPIMRSTFLWTPGKQI